MCPKHFWGCINIREWPTVMSSLENNEHYFQQKKFEPDLPYQNSYWTQNIYSIQLPTQDMTHSQRHFRQSLLSVKSTSTGVVPFRVPRDQPLYVQTI